MPHVVKARLRGEDSLVWPIEKGYGPTWRPNYAEAEADFGSELGETLMRALRSGESFMVDGRKFWVESVESEWSPE